MLFAARANLLLIYAGVDGSDHRKSFKGVRVPVRIMTACFSCSQSMICAISAGNGGGNTRSQLEASDGDKHCSPEFHGKAGRRFGLREPGSPRAVRAAARPARKGRRG